VEVSSFGSLTVSPKPTARTTGAAVTYAVSSTVDTPVSITGGSTQSLTSTNKYLFIKVVSGDGTKESIYRIAVSIVQPKPDITAASLGSATIYFNGGQAGTSEAAAIEGYERLSGTAAATISVTAPGATNREYAVTTGAGSFAYTTGTSLDFTAGRTLWIRTQYVDPVSGDLVSARYYKVLVNLDPQELKDPVLRSSSPVFERPVYLSPGKTGNSVADAIEGDVTVPAVTVSLVGGSNSAQSRALVDSTIIPTADQITGSISSITIPAGDDTILWVKIASWEKESDGITPASYKFYKIRVAVTTGTISDAEQFISSYKNSFSGGTLIRLSDDTVQLKGNGQVTMTSSVSPSNSINLYVDGGVSLNTTSSNTLTDKVTVHAQGPGGLGGRSGVLAYRSGSSSLSGVIAGAEGVSDVSTALGTLLTSYQAIRSVAPVTLSFPNNYYSSGAGRDYTSLSSFSNGAFDGGQEFFQIGGTNYYIGARIYYSSSSGCYFIEAVYLSRPDFNYGNTPYTTGSHTFNINVGRVYSGGLSVNGPTVQVNVSWVPYS
jgi:hypothetical protein